MITDPTADMITRIRNAQIAKHSSVRVPKSKTTLNILQVLKDEGFIQSFEEKKDDNAKFAEYDIALKYYSSGEPAIGMLRKFSTPGRRVYKGTGELPKVFGGLGLAIISTSQGVMSDREARKRGIGGEIVALVG